MAEQKNGNSIPGLTIGGLMMAVGTVIATYAWHIDSKYDQRIADVRITQEAQRVMQEQKLENEVYKARKELTELLLVQKEDMLRMDRDDDANTLLLAAKIDGLTKTVIELSANLNNLFSRGKR